MQREPAEQEIRILDLVLYYLRLGALGFGGPVALCGQMERELVGDRKWLTRERAENMSARRPPSSTPAAAPLPDAAP